MNEQLQANYREYEMSYHEFRTRVWSDHLSTHDKDVLTKTDLILEDILENAGNYDIEDIPKLEEHRMILSCNMSTVGGISAFARSMSGVLSTYRSLAEGIDFIKWREQKIAQTEAQERARQNTRLMKLDEIYWDKLYRDFQAYFTGIKEQCNALAGKINTLKESEARQRDNYTKQQYEQNTAPHQSM